MARRWSHTPRWRSFCNVFPALHDRSKGYVPTHERTTSRLIGSVHDAKGWLGRVWPSAGIAMTLGGLTSRSVPARFPSADEWDISIRACLGLRSTRPRAVDRAPASLLEGRTPGATGPRSVRPAPVPCAGHPGRRRASTCFRHARSGYRRRSAAWAPRISVGSARHQRSPTV